MWSRKMRAQIRKKFLNRGTGPRSGIEGSARGDSLTMSWVTPFRAGQNYSTFSKRSVWSFGRNAT
jgi:hypothetical protein